MLRLCFEWTANKHQTVFVQGLRFKVQQAVWQQRTEGSYKQIEEIALTCLTEMNSYETTHCPFKEYFLFLD